MVPYKDANTLLANIKNNHELNLSIFRGRDDVVAKRWECIGEDGKKRAGFTPICLNRKNKDICPKSQNKKQSCAKCTAQNYSGVTRQDLDAHFDGKFQLGCYPLLQDATSWFVAADFDNHDPENKPRNPLADVQAFVKVANNYNIPVYVLSSRSGNGYHVYAFFAEPIPATISRSAFLGMLMEAGINVTCKKDGSYDRLFPSQDKHSGAGFGNLIGMPFQGEAVRRGCTLFINPDTNDPFAAEEQIQMLHNIKRATINDLKRAPQYIVQNIPIISKNNKDTNESRTQLVIPNALPTGCRNDYLFKLTCSLISKGVAEETLRQAVNTENQQKCSPPLDDNELENIINGALARYATGQQNTYKFALTDLGNAERFAAQHMNKAKYSHERKQWLVWDGKRFEDNNLGQIHQYAHATIRSIYGEAATAQSEDERKAVQ